VKKLNEAVTNIDNFKKDRKRVLKNAGKNDLIDIIIKLELIVVQQNYKIQTLQGGNNGTQQKGQRIIKGV
jgi:hypothetical protein